MNILNGYRSVITALLDRPTGDRSDEQAHGRSPGSRAYRRRRLPGSRSSGVRRRHSADSRGGGHGSAEPTVFPFHPLRQRDRTRWMSQLPGALSNSRRSANGGNREVVSLPKAGIPEPRHVRPSLAARLPGCEKARRNFANGRAEKKFLQFFRFCAVGGRVRENRQHG